MINVIDSCHVSVKIFYCCYRWKLRQKLNYYYYVITCLILFFNLLGWVKSVCLSSGNFHQHENQKLENLRCLVQDMQACKQFKKSFNQILFWFRRRWQFMKSENFQQKTKLRKGVSIWYFNDFGCLIHLSWSSQVLFSNSRPTWFGFDLKVQGHQSRGD